MSSAYKGTNCWSDYITKNDTDVIDSMNVDTKTAYTILIGKYQQKIQRPQTEAQMG